MDSFKYSRCVTALAGVAWTFIFSSAGAIAGTPELEVLSFQGLSNSPPGFPGLYWNLSGGTSNPVIDESGKVAFLGTIFGDGVTSLNNRVMWVGDENGWTVVARSGTPALNLARLTFTGLNTNSPALAPNGIVSIGGTVAGSGVTTANDTAFWYGNSSSPSLIAREGTTVAPNSGGALLTSAFNGMSMGNSYRANGAGQVLFSSSLGAPATTTNNVGVYIGSSSGLVEVARKGNPMPGAPALPATDGPFMTPDTFGFFLNGAGEVAHTGTLVAGTAGGVTTSDDKVLYTTVGGPQRIVAREGSAVPGMTDVKYKAATSFTIATMGLNNGGKIVFNATLDNIAPGTGVTTTNDTAWLVDDHGTISTLIREGDSIDSETFSAAQFSGGVFLTNSNRVVINGFTTAAAPNNRLWTGPLGGPYTRIVTQGVTTVPGDSSVVLDYTASSANVAVNSLGQLVFISALTGPSVTVGVDDIGMFGWDPTSGLVLIARKGVTPVPGIIDTTQVSLIGATGVTGENTSAMFTDNGWLTFRIQDIKGFQAIIRTKPFALPCPADVDDNGSVNTDDLLLLIGSWGACADPNNCPADIDGNDLVNTDDLLVIIGGWGACP